MSAKDKSALYSRHLQHLNTINNLDFLEKREHLNNHVPAWFHTSNTVKAPRIDQSSVGRESEAAAAAAKASYDISIQAGSDFISQPNRK